MTVQFNLVCCTQVLLHEIAAKEAKQMDVALTYAMAVKSEIQGADKPDWRAINEAIIARWSMSGLKRIKTRAHGILEGGGK